MENWISLKSKIARNSASDIDKEREGIRIWT